MATLTFWEKNPALAAAAACSLAAVPVEAKADPKGNKDTAHTLTLCSG